MSRRAFHGVSPVLALPFREDDKALEASGVPRVERV